MKPGPVFLQVKAPSRALLDGETLKSVMVKAGATTPGVDITLSGRPSDRATYVGGKACAACHEGPHTKALNGTPNASIHSRFVTEGTSHMVYKDKWPAPGEKYLPRDPKGNLLKVQDPLDGTGLVHLLTTRGQDPNLGDAGSSSTLSSRPG
ncbi:MAG: hypothetical protein IPP58_13675 [Holophagaceae bacterium]|uniref:Cytochrome c domain-containing protein n=1 Tax=Candidatus Geothrix skivensis TaxID=2954439 RepID=A0A9D7SJB7_9BACT|nr:hypothetical protein [Candidatus Geothrix skivensis]